MLRIAIVVALLLSFGAAAGPAGAQLVNGSFEPASGTGSWMVVAGGSSVIPGWVTTDNGVEWTLGSSGGAPAPDGLHVVDLACYVYSAGGIQQTFATTPGVPYTITFMLGTLAASGRDGTCQIVVDADAQSQTFSHTNVSGVIAYASKNFTFIADNASATLRFRCLQNANAHFAYLDAVSTEAVVSDTPAAWGDVKALFR
jgi:hypothetical protein